MAIDRAALHKTRTRYQRRVIERLIYHYEAACSPLSDDDRPLSVFPDGSSLPIYARSEAQRGRTLFDNDRVGITTTFRAVYNVSFFGPEYVNVFYQRILSTYSIAGYTCSLYENVWIVLKHLLDKDYF